MILDSKIKNEPNVIEKSINQRLMIPECNDIIWKITYPKSKDRYCIICNIKYIPTNKLNRNKCQSCMNIISTRNCPACHVVLSYKSKHAHQEAVKNNSSCKSCSNKGKRGALGIIPWNKKYFTKGEQKIAEKNWSKSANIRNKDKIRRSKAKYYESNKIKIIKRCKIYYQLNKLKINSKTRNRRNTNLNVKLKHNLRARLTRAIANNQKAGSAVSDLGCSIPEFKKYIESKFSNGMTWDNYGIRGWHIDHIKPLSKFNLSNRDEFLKACHYTNLQPLWAAENYRKNKKYD